MEYFDTSILVPFYCPEPKSVVAEKLILQSSRPTISKLSEVEFASAVSLKIRTGQLDLATAKKVAIRFEQHVSASYFDVLPLTENHLKHARDWIARFATPLRTLDAIHLAIAHIHQYELVTADQLLEKSAAILGVKCRLI